MKFDANVPIHFHSSRANSTRAHTIDEKNVKKYISGVFVRIVGRDHDCNTMYVFMRANRFSMRRSVDSKLKHNNDKKQPTL